MSKRSNHQFPKGYSIIQIEPFALPYLCKEGHVRVYTLYFHGLQLVSVCPQRLYALTEVMPNILKPFPPQISTVLSRYALLLDTIANPRFRKGRLKMISGET